MYDIKYDRQIRLFGKDVQSKLSNLSVSIFSERSDNFISGEILKNLVLLGVNKIYADKNTLISFNKLVPNDIKEINPKINILNNPEGIFFVIGNLKNFEFKEGFYVSSDSHEFSTTKCFKENKKESALLKDNALMEEGASFKDNASLKDSVLLKEGAPMEELSMVKESSIVKDCLLGALVVQEFIKMVQNQEYQNYFSIDSIFQSI